MYDNANDDENPITFRSCLDFTANKFKKILFCLFEVLFGIFVLSVLANRPLFAANREYKSTQKVFSTKLEIKFKQLLTIYKFTMYYLCTIE